jgi:hypothetical protein
MCDRINEIIATGHPLALKDNLATDIKTWYMGGKSRWQFSCTSCGKTIVTSSEYNVIDPEIVRATKAKIERNALWFISSLFHEIPILGKFLNMRFQDIMRKKLDNIDEGKYRKTQCKAFEEIKSQFSVCSVCGQYSCSSCHSNGTCGNCASSKTTADKGKQEMLSQLQYIDKMYNDLIAKNPEQREMLEQQKQNAIKTINHSIAEIDKGLSAATLG